MPSPSRIPAGISTAAKGSTLFNYPAPDPTKTIEYFNDFYQYTAGDWTITRVGVTPTEGLVDNETGGALILTMAATDNSADQLQLGTSTTGECFLPIVGKKAWFKTRFKISDATQSDFLMGLAVHDTSVISTGTGFGDDVSDGIFFYKDDGSTSIKLSAQKNTTTGQTAPATVGTCTTSYMVLGWEWDGARYIKGFFNDVHTCTLDLTTTASTYLPDTNLTITMAIMNGEAVSKTMTIDYIFAAQER
jgi:hypothetical protein